MNDKLVNALLFAGGVVVGSLVTWQLTKETYKKLAAEEIASVREYYRGKYEEPQDSGDRNGDTERPPYSHKREVAQEEKETITRYSSLANAYNSPENEQEVEYVTEPYVISPDLFGELEDYEIKSLTYYKDGILADDEGNIVTDADDLVGKDFVNHFGDYEDDAVHIRSEWAQCDYEIIYVETRYSDIRNRTPHQMEVE